jgi:hypothetical protein
VYRGGSDWMTPAQMTALAGAPSGALYAVHPLANQPRQVLPPLDLGNTAPPPQMLAVSPPPQSTPAAVPAPASHTVTPAPADERPTLIQAPPPRKAGEANV